MIGRFIAECPAFESQNKNKWIHLFFALGLPIFACEKSSTPEMCLPHTPLGGTAFTFNVSIESQFVTRSQYDNLDIFKILAKYAIYQINGAQKKIYALYASIDKMTV